MKEKTKYILIFLGITLIGLLYNYKYINDFPSHIHAWAQSDRYSLAIGFTENKLNIFKPQTFVYNRQFPDKWEKSYTDKIVSVDFPIHDYIPAIIMSLTKNQSFWIFRLYILIYSFFGLFFLFRLSREITNSNIKAGLITFIAATSPIFVYYQAGFLPTIPSLANAMIGLYFYYKYLQNNKNKLFIISLLFLTLSTLARTSFAIPLIAVLCIEFLRVIRKDTSLKPKIIPLIISLLLIISYYFYNQYLRENHGSIFLKNLMLPKNTQEVKDILKYIKENWLYQYFSLYNFITFLLIIILSIFFFIKRLLKANYQFLNIKINYFYLFILTYLFGTLCFFFLMMKQFVNHDYYFLDSFFLPTLLIITVLLTLLPNIELRKRNPYSISVLITLSFLSILMFIQPFKTQSQRRETGDWDFIGHSINNYQGSNLFLDSLGISSSAKIMALRTFAPNIPFILMKRSGYAIMSFDSSTTNKIFEWDYDYIVFENENFLTNIYAKDSNILKKIRKIATNGKISICKPSSNNPQTILEFLELNKKKIGYKYTDTSSYIMDSKTEFDLNIKIDDLSFLNNKNGIMVFNADFKIKDEKDIYIVANIKSNNKDIYYYSYPISAKDFWVNIPFIFSFPKLEGKDKYSLILYIWNNGGDGELYYKNPNFSIYY
ncbi:MAG: glycosyltransferase family 39 protein [Bacteroidales bacterium]|jgi:hypothetical protein|nr:glycosyltransferase family 39 protein [Bacteroidales bacterium]MDD4068610.1 glycosyltransferase family 39 protein [Bacteroidales bacterium]MDD4739100.1 glycosyltransferase family 39 protein [Bacteroidales bacterium]